MADVFLTRTQLEDVFQPVIASILGWTGEDANRVRLSWIAGGAPAISIDKNYVFLQVMETDHPINRQRDNYFEDSSPDIRMCKSYTRVILVNLVLYGADSFDNAMTIRDGMFSQIVRETLAKQNLYLVPNIVSPRRVPENFQGQWWERTDMQLMFNELVVRESTVNEILVSEIEIWNKDGKISEIELPN